jgi:hypothetical protein
VGVGAAETAEEHGLAVGAIVAVAVLQEEEVRGVGDVDAAVADGDAAGDVEALGEDLDLVDASVAVAVLQDLHAVAAGPRLAARVLEALGDPDAAARVEGHGHRVGDLRLRGGELDAEAGRHRDLLARLLRRERRPGRTVLVVRDALRSQRVGASATSARARERQTRLEGAPA